MKYLKSFEKHKEFDIDSVGSRVSFITKKELLEYIKSGGDLDVRDSESNTPLIRAVRNNKSEIVDILIKGGADLNMHNIKGETPLIVATRFSSTNINIIFNLIEAGAQWNIRRRKDKDIDNLVDIGFTNIITSRFYKDNDFFDMLSPKKQEIIKEKYPEKYAKYLAKKEYSK